MNLTYFAHPQQVEAAKTALGSSVEVVATQKLPEKSEEMREIEQQSPQCPILDAKTEGRHGRGDNSPHQSRSLADQGYGDAGSTPAAS
jgi:hypothetical protein